jgi:putative phosphoesterase
MKIVIISDIHANMEALEALPTLGDQLWVLGDLVNYGPDPVAVVDWVRKHATVVVRGNHDHAAASGEDPRCSAPFREMSDAMLAYTQASLRDDQREYLSSLPLVLTERVEGLSFFLCHATPSDPLFRYIQADSPQWAEECELAAADILLTGHTHIPFIRTVGQRIVANPGSIGQPKTGSPLACYAVWDDDLQLHSYPYDCETTARKIERLAVPQSGIGRARPCPTPERVKHSLAGVLRTGCWSSQC